MILVVFTTPERGKKEAGNWTNRPNLLAQLQMTTANPLPGLEGGVKSIDLEIHLNLTYFLKIISITKAVRMGEIGEAAVG